MHQIIFNDRFDAALCALFVLVVLAILYFSIRSCIAAYRTPRWTAAELPSNVVPAE